MVSYVKAKPIKPKSRFQKIITKISIILVLFLSINYLLGRILGINNIYGFYTSILHPKNWIELFSYPIKKHSCELKGGKYHKCSFFWAFDCGCKMPGNFISL